MVYQSTSKVTPVFWWQNLTISWRDLTYPLVSQYRPLIISLLMHSLVPPKSLVCTTLHDKTKLRWHWVPMARFNMRRKLTNWNLILNRLLRSCTVHDYDFISINMYNIKDNSCELLYFIFVPNFGLAAKQLSIWLDPLFQFQKKFQVSKKVQKIFEKNPKKFIKIGNNSKKKVRNTKKSSYILT